MFLICINKLKNDDVNVVEDNKKNNNINQIKIKII